MALSPLNGPSGIQVNPVSQSLEIFQAFSGIASQGMQISEIFEKATERFQNEISALQAQGSSLSKSFLALLDRITLAEENESKNEELHKENLKKSEEALSALCERLDIIADPLDIAAKKLKEVSNKTQEVRLGIETIRQENAAQANQLNEFKTVLEKEDKALQAQINTAGERPKAVIKRIEGVKAQIKTIQTNEAAARAGMGVIEGRFTGHTHHLTYRCMGNNDSAGTGGPNK